MMEIETQSPTEVKSRIEVELSDLLDLDGNLTAINLGQLQAFVALADQLQFSKAAKRVGRHQKACTNQINTLARNLTNAGFSLDQLVLPSKRGEDVKLTDAGIRVATMGQEILQSVFRAKDDLRMSQGILKVASTTFLLPVLFRVWWSWSQENEALGRPFSLRIQRIRSSEVQSILTRRKVDLSFGGTVAHGPEEKPQLHSGLEFIEYSRDDICLLTNIPPQKWRHGDPISIKTLAENQIPVILPESGLVLDFVKEVLGEELQQGKLNVVEWCNDVYFGIDLMRYGRYNACMLCTQTVVDWVGARPSTQAGIKAKDLYSHEIEGPLPKVVVGLFRRSGEDDYYEKMHILPLCWRTFDKMVNDMSEAERKITPWSH